MKRHVTLVLFCIGILALILGAVFSGFALNEIYLLRPREDALEIRITINSGDSAKMVAQKLAGERLIASPFLFTLYVRARGLAVWIRSGTYSFQQGSSMSRILHKMTAGIANEESITFIEGWTIKEIAHHLEKYTASSSVITAQSFLDAVATSTEIIPALARKPPGASLEGFLFPDTYHFAIGAVPEDVVGKMLAAFQKKVYEPYGAVQYRGHGFYDILTMASVVEREVRDTEDRKKVSDIFWRRLQIGMPLQADSTVNYVTGKKTPAISSHDRIIDSPYNTYRVRGLPPTPISNPGLDAIRAALEPTPNEYWYFLTDQEGGVHYAVTLEEHNQNKARYLNTPR